MITDSKNFTEVRCEIERQITEEDRKASPRKTYLLSTTQERGANPFIAYLSARSILEAESIARRFFPTSIVTVYRDYELYMDDEIHFDI